MFFLLSYLKIRKVNQAMERKVISWFDYLWTNRQTLDDDDVLITLPEKLRYALYQYNY